MGPLTDRLQGFVFKDCLAVLILCWGGRKKGVISVGHMLILCSHYAKSAVQNLNAGYKPPFCAFKSPTNSLG